MAEGSRGWGWVLAQYAVHAAEPYILLMQLYVGEVLARGVVFHLFHVTFYHRGCCVFVCFG